MEEKMTKHERKKVVFIGIALLTIILVLGAAGCASTAPPEHLKEQDVTMNKKTGIRIATATFDTTFSRNEYFILGTVTGSGTVERRLVEEGEKPKAESGGGLFSGKQPEGEKDSYFSYYVLDYDRSYGTWTDEGMDSVDAIKDGNGNGAVEMSASEQDYLKRLETIAARIALYNALKEMPEADAVLLPKYEFKYVMTESVQGQEWVVARKVKSVTATVTGRAIRIKKDEELYQTYRDFPELIPSK